MTQEDEILNDETNSEVSINDPRVFPGELLRTAREAKGLTTQEVATYLCLRRQLIEEIEESKFDPKVAATFIRGYLKSYAKYVGASETAVLAAYSDLVFEKPKLDDMQSFSRKKAIETQDSRLMLITYIIVAVLVASFILFIWQQSGSDAELSNGSGQPSPAVSSQEMQQVQQPATESTQDESSTHEDAVPADNIQAIKTQAIPVTARESSAQPAVQPNVSTAAETTAAITATAAGQQGTTTQAQSRPPEVTEQAAETVTESAEPEVVPPTFTRTGTFLDEADPTAGELVLYFLAPTWVEVLNANDFENRLAFGIKRRGYNMPLGGAEAYTIAIDVPYAVEVYYRGEPVDLTALYEGQVGLIRVPRLQP